MNTVQNGKGDSPRNNWGSQWYEGYDAINWQRPDPKRQPVPPAEAPNGREKKAVPHHTERRCSAEATLDA